MDDAKQIEIERWLIKADHDIRAARSSLKEDPPITDVACFHAQQCAEKSLKAFMVFHDRQVLKTHDLLKLLMICTEYDQSFEEWGDIVKCCGRGQAATRSDDVKSIPSVNFTPCHNFLA